MILQTTLNFLSELKHNNNRDWFNIHRPEYEAARENYGIVVNQLIAGIKEFDPSIGTLEAKDCWFRINRDIRFSPNKEPYKTNMGAYIARGGRKSPFAGYYFHLEPGESFISGGIYMAPPENMKRIRSEINAYSNEFLKIVSSNEFTSAFSHFDSESLKRVPQGFSADSPVVDYLKMKHITPYKKINDVDLVSKNLLSSSLSTFKALHPLVQFLNRAIEE
jgi:uncharacterized protein (TIGR02453 family)